MRWKKVVPVVALLVAVCAAFGFFGPFRSGPQALRLPGVVEIQEVRLGSKVGGRVEEVYVLEGARVRPGDPLVRFEVPELKAQKAQLEARLQEAKVELHKAEYGSRLLEVAAAQAAAEAAEARYHRIKAGARLQEIDQAQGELDAALADLKWARDEYARTDRLLSQGTAARAEHEAARATLDRAQGRAGAAQARLNLLKAGSRQEEIDEAAAEHRRARANLDLLQKTRQEAVQSAAERVKELEAKLEELEANLKEAVVTAKEPAVVEVVGVRKGDLVPPNQPVLRVLRDADLWVKVFVPETSLHQIRLGQEVEVVIDSGQRFPGQVIHIASESEFTPRNVQSADQRKHQVFGVKVRVDDPQGAVKAGMAAEVLVPLQ